MKDSKTQLLEILGPLGATPMPSSHTMHRRYYFIKIIKLINYPYEK